MVRKQNERTLLLHSRIIPLTLHPIFHILAPPRPLSTRLGAFSSPKHFPRKNFRKIFYINQSFGADFFLYFRCEKLCFLGANFFLLLWCEKLWGLNTLSAPQMGGCPFSYALHIAGTKKGGLMSSLSVRNLRLISNIHFQPSMSLRALCMLP